MIYEAILFDMDGVITDTEHTVTAFWERLAARHGVTITSSDWLQHIYGVPVLTTLAAVFPMVTAEETQTVFDELEAYELTIPYTEMPGAIEFLRALKAHGIPTAVVTSGDRWKLDEVMRQLGITGIFDVTVPVNDITRGKPHPDGYLLAAERLGKAPERCIVFEDSLPGVRAGVASGATCIGVRAPEYAPTLIDLGAAHVIANFSGVHVRSDGESTSLQLAPGVSLSFASAAG
ncbi:MAG: HAD family phosphatase [Anaerolineae bacterium]|nr:HAD family phosphatase [Anaerolineae bacterium]